jgi:photosystem II stability/assembly factor-like uncharacterized protein
MWPTLRWLHPATVHHVTAPAAYASYDVDALSASDAYVVLRPPGSVSAGALYRTQDAGATWHVIALPALATGNDFSITGLPGGSLFLRSFNFSNGGQQFYMRNGSTWTEIKVPDQGSGSLTMIDARIGFWVVPETAPPASPELLIYRTQDGGRSWKQMLNLNLGHASGGGLELAENHTFITFADSMHGWLVVIPRSWGIVCGTPNPTDPVQRLMTTEDGGSNWKSVSLPDLPLGSTEIGTPVFRGAGMAGYLTVLGRTYVGQCPVEGVTFAYATLDAGATWSGPRRVPVPFFDSPDGIVWWATDGRNLLRSSDQGQSWETSRPKVPSDVVELQGLFVVNATAAWSIWSEGSDQSQPQPQALLRTTDAGAHWSAVKLPG